METKRKPEARVQEVIDRQTKRMQLLDRKDSEEGFEMVCYAYHLFPRGYSPIEAGADEHLSILAELDREFDKLNVPNQFDLETVSRYLSNN